MQKCSATPSSRRYEATTQEQKGSSTRLRRVGSWVFYAKQRSLCESSDLFHPQKNIGSVLWLQITIQTVTRSAGRGFILSVVLIFGLSRMPNLSRARVKKACLGALCPYYHEDVKKFAQIAFQSQKILTLPAKAKCRSESFASVCLDHIYDLPQDCCSVI